MEDCIAYVAECLRVHAKEVTLVETLREKHGHRLCRVKAAGCTYVLKWFPDVESAVEVQAYALLENLGIPTLPIHARTDRSLVLEDLAASADWRLATDADDTRADVGAAVARWYQSLHTRGAELLRAASNLPTFLTRETDIVTPESIALTGRALGLESLSVWRLATEHIDDLKSAACSLEQTLNYNDFHWTNLALSRSATPPLQAIVLDYHLLGIGLRYSDCRNVTGSLRGEAVSAFWEAYGPPDEREAVLDRPLSVLVALVAAVRLPRFPAWARNARNHAAHGGLERDLRRAIQTLRA